MPQSLDCPNCSAPLDLEGDGSATLRCPYCNTSVIIPEELRVSKPSHRSTAAKINTFDAPSEINLDERLKSIREKALAGDKIEAIRLLRRTYVIGLSKAKDRIEAMQRGEEVDLSDLQVFTPARGSSISLDPSTMRDLMHLIDSGEKIEAIKLFRAKTGVGLKDAKEVIEGMEVGLATPQSDVAAELGRSISYSAKEEQTVSTLTKKASGGRNCLVIGFVLFMLLVTVVPILVGMTSQGGPLAGFWARVNPFAPGNVTLEFGQAGTGPGYFTDARFVSVDNTGHIFVGEFNGGRIQVFDMDGNYLTQWNATGEETGDIYLSGMAANRNGAVYTVVGSQLYVYDGMTGNLLSQLDHPDGWGFDDVTVAPDGSVVAAWCKNRDDLIRFDRNGQSDLLVMNAISNVTNDSELDMRVAVDGTGNIYTLAYFNEAVFIFSHDGKYVSRFGSRGDGDGQFTSPRSIVVDNLGKVYIADFPGIMIYANDGRYLDTLPVNGAVMGMAFDDQNNLYVIAGEQVLRFKLK